MQQKPFSVVWLRRGWHLRPEALDGLQTRAPVRLQLQLGGVALSVLEDRGEPVADQAELAHEQREVLRRDELEVADGGELGHAGRALYDHAEVLVLVQAVRKGGDGAERVRLDDDVDELELRRERVEAVGHARVVPDDPHEVVPDVPLFVVEVRVVLVVRHQRRGVVQDLPDVVPPRVRVLAVFVRVEPPGVHVHLTAQVDQPPEAFEEARVRRRAVIIAQDVPFVRLARRDVHDSDFVRVDDGHPVQRTEESGETGRVHHLASPLTDVAPVLRQLQREKGRIDGDFFPPLRRRGSLPDVTSDGIRPGRRSLFRLFRFWGVECLNDILRGRRVGSQHALTQETETRAPGTTRFPLRATRGPWPASQEPKRRRDRPPPVPPSARFRYGPICASGPTRDAP